MPGPIGSRALEYVDECSHNGGDSKGPRSVPVEPLGLGERDTSLHQRRRMCERARGYAVQGDTCPDGGELCEVDAQAMTSGLGNCATELECGTRGEDGVRREVSGQIPRIWQPLLGRRGRVQATSNASQPATPTEFLHQSTPLALGRPAPGPTQPVVDRLDRPKPACRGKVLESLHTGSDNTGRSGDAVARRFAHTPGDPPDTVRNRMSACKVSDIPGGDRVHRAPGVPFGSSERSSPLRSAMAQCGGRTAATRQ